MFIIIISTQNLHKKCLKDGNELKDLSIIKENLQSQKVALIGSPEAIAEYYTEAKHYVDRFLVLEREAIAGGLCRSEDVDGSPFDIGGGHFLDVKNPKVTDFVFVRDG